MPTLVIDQLTLFDLEQRFGLHQRRDRAFFPEWQTPSLTLTAAEQARLQRIQSAYANLERRSVLENTVQLAVVAPLLDLAGFCLPPFYVDTETSVELVVPGASAAALPSPDLRSDEPASDQPASDLTLRGRMDVLVGLGRLWVLVIESKRSAFSTAIGIPQVLSYRLTASPAEPGDRYGLVTNGSHFVFVKLGPVSPDRWDYAKSQEFILDRKDALAQVLQIMKQLGAIALQPHTAAVPPAPAELDRGDPGDGVSGD